MAQIPKTVMTKVGPKRAKRGSLYYEGLLTLTSIVRGQNSVGLSGWDGRTVHKCGHIKFMS